MAQPVRNAYSVGAGQTIYGGMSAPGALSAAVVLDDAQPGGAFSTVQSALTGNVTAGDATLGGGGFAVYYPIPAAGYRANVNLNTADSVDYDKLGGLYPNNLAQRWWTGYGAVGTTTAFESMTGAYSGSLFAPEYGSNGALIAYGGGHGGQQGQIAYVFDFADLKWHQVGAPANLPTDFTWAGYTGTAETSYSAGSDLRDANWFDYLFNGSYVKLISHSYTSQNVYIPAAYAGGDSKGAIYIPESDFRQVPSTTNGAGNSRLWAPHLFGLTAGQMSRALTAPLGMWGVTGVNTVATVRDTTRNRLWHFVSATAAAKYADLAGGPPYVFNAHTLQNLAGGNVAWTQVVESTWVYVAELDAMACFIPQHAGGTAAVNDLMGVWLYDCSTGFPRLLSTTVVPQQAVARGGLHIGVDWSTTEHAFYLYEGRGDTYCYVLRPSSISGWKTATWTWTREDFAGPTPAARSPLSGAGASQEADCATGRWRWVPSLGCFCWHDGPSISGQCFDGVTRNGLMQLWRPPGSVF